MEKALTTCKNCGNSFSGKFCNSCGEKVYGEHDRSLFHFFEEGFHFVTHFEGSFLTTIKTFILSPGKVSDDYCYGIRKKYFKPLSLFLLLVVIYLLFPRFEGLNMRLPYHEKGLVYGNYASEKIKAVLANTHLTETQLEEAFHAKGEKTSKFLLLILIPLTALWFWLLTFRKRKYFFDQIIFATEANCIFILFGFLIFPLILKLIEIPYRAAFQSPLMFSDLTSSIIIYIVVCVYVSIGSRRFYQLNRMQSVLFGILFYAAHGIIVGVIYKFLSFVITINQIH